MYKIFIFAMIIKNNIKKIIDYPKIRNYHPIHD